jgi:hypothetical protein
VDGDQSEPLRIGECAGHRFGLPQKSQHFLELAERIERAPQLEAHIDLLFPGLPRLRQVAQRLQRLFETCQSLLVRRPPLGLSADLAQVGHSLVPHLTPAGMMGQPLEVLHEPLRIRAFDGVNDAGVQGLAPVLQHAAIGDFVRECVLEGVLHIGEEARFV